MTRTVTATFANGRTISRRSTATYTHAAKRHGHVTLHTSEGAARRAAGRFGEVVATSAATPARPCVVCEGTGEITYGPSAVDRTMTTVPCHRCQPCR